MGIKHLVAVQEFLRANKRKSFTKTHLLRSVGMNLYQANECLEYLVKENKVEKFIENGHFRYKAKK